MSQLPSFLEELEFIDRQSAMAFFEEATVPAGELLMHGTYEAECLAYVVQGEVEVHAGGSVVGRAGAKEWVGESAMFAEATRKATVYALTDCWLLALTTEGYTAMRKGEHRVIPFLEQEVLTQQLARLRRIGDQLAEHSKGGVEAPLGASFLSIVAAQFGAGGALSPATIDVGAELLRHGLADDTEPTKVVQGVARYFQAESVPAGRVLCEEGKPGDAMYILVDGQVDVIKSVKGDRVEQLANLEPGAAFGLAALHEDRNRMASCVAVAQSTVLRLDEAGWAALAADATPVGSCFRRAMIRVLSDQLAVANLCLADVAAEPSRLPRAQAAFEAAASWPEA